MLDVTSSSPLPVAVVPGLDLEGRARLTVVVKATYRLREDGLVLADEQVPILHADTFHGEPGASSVRHEADLAPEKPGTDVVLLGYAWSPSPVASLEVSLLAGPIKKRVRVTGDRAFYKVGGSFAVSDPRPFSRLPLVWERAFGGVDGEAFEERNPAGTGFLEGAERAEGVLLPNLEDPRHLLARPGERPPPTGLGFVPRHWMPRRAFAGTHDEAWRAERFPLLPADFDPRFFQGAPADQISARPFAGGEPVRVEGAAEGGPIAFDLPRAEISIGVSIRRVEARHRPQLDTVILEPDERRVILVHRVAVACPPGYLLVDRVTVDLGRAS